MIFEDSRFAWLFFLVPVVIGLFYLQFLLYRRRLNRFVSVTLRQHVIPTLSWSRRFWASVLRVGIVIGLIFCLLRPQYGVKLEEMSRRGHDIYIALTLPQTTPLTRKPQP